MWLFLPKTERLRITVPVRCGDVLASGFRRLETGGLLHGDIVRLVHNAHRINLKVGNENV
jgi:hypothetical protein